MADTEVGLVWRLRAQGTREVQQEIQRITGGLTQARTTAAQAPNVSGWKTSLGSVHNEARSLFGTLGKIAAWGGLAAGAFGVQSVVKSFLSLSEEMRGIQTSTGKTDSEIAQLTQRFRTLATEIGKPAAEIAGLADLINDLGASFERAAEAAPKLELLAGAFKVEDVKGIATAFASLEKLSGGKLSVDKQMAMLREILLSTPLAEEATLEAVTRSGGRAASIGRMEGPQGIASLGGILATLGKTYGGQERKIQSGLEAILDGFEAQLTDPKVRAALGRLGINMTDAGTMFDSMLKVLSTTPTALDKIEGLPPELGTILRGAVRNHDVYNRAMEKISGDTAALAASLDARKNDPAVKLGQATERLKAAIEPLITTLMPKIVSAVEKITPWLERFASFAASNGDLILAFLAAMAMRSVAATAGLMGPGGGGGVPMMLGAGGGLMPMPAGAGGAPAPYYSPMPPRRAGMRAGLNNELYPQANADFAAAREARNAGPGWGTAIAGAAGAAAAGMVSLIGPMMMVRNAFGILSGEASPTRGFLEGKMRERSARDASATGGVRAVVQAVRTEMGLDRGGGPVGGVVDRMREIQITIQQTTNVSPDGTTGTARAATDARNGATVQVRDEYSGSYRPPPMR